VANDLDQKRLEIVKLRIDVLKQVTTLSGAATLIVLAISQQVQTLKNVVLLGIAGFYFGTATLVALFHMMWLLRMLDRTDSVRQFRGQLGMEVATGLLWAGVLAIMGVVFRVSMLTAGIVIAAGGVILLLAWLVLYRYSRPTDARNDGAEERES
jgi:hypothetical protein